MVFIEGVAGSLIKFMGSFVTSVLLYQCATPTKGLPLVAPCSVASTVNRNTPDVWYYLLHP